MLELPLKVKSLLQGNCRDFTNSHNPHSHTLTPFPHTVLHEHHAPEHHDRHHEQLVCQGHTGIYGLRERKRSNKYCIRRRIGLHSLKHILLVILPYKSITLCSTCLHRMRVCASCTPEHRSSMSWKPRCPNSCRVHAGTHRLCTSSRLVWSRDHLD